MAYIQLQESKDHLRVDFEDDDSYITSLINMVENMVESEIGEPLEDLEDEDGNLPLRLVQSMLLMIGHFYLVREPIIIGTGTSEVPYSFKFLIAPFKNYTIK